MKNLLANLRSSIREISKIQVITVCGILLALRLVLGMLEINIGGTYRISFSALPVSLSGYLFGPIPGLILGALGDVLTLIINPTGPLNPGILFSKAFSGFLMGLFLYKKPISLPRTIVSNIVVVIICNLIITTASICWMYNTPVAVVLPTRIITNLITLPFNIAFLFGAQKLVAKLNIKQLSLSN